MRWKIFQYELLTDPVGLNTCLVHELGHFRKDQIGRTTTRVVDVIIVSDIRLNSMIGAQRLNEVIIRSTAIDVGIIMTIHGASSWDVQE